MKSLACTDVFVPGDQYICYGMGITSGLNYLANSVGAKDIYDRYNAIDINKEMDKADDQWDAVLKE